MKQLLNLLVIVCLLTIAQTAPALAEDMGEITCGDTQSGQIATVGEEDTWTFTGQAGERILVDAEVIAGTMDMRLLLYPPGGGSYVASGNESFSYKLAVSGTYTLRVYDHAADETGDYMLSYYNLQGCPWPSISCAETLSGSIDNPSEFAIYQIEGQAGQRILVDAEVTGGTMDMRLLLYPPSGGDYVDAGDQGLSYKLQESGTYYLRVYDYRADDTGDYLLSYYNLQGCSWPSLSCGETLAGSIDNPSEFDIYAIEGQAGERIIVDAEVTGGTMDMRLLLYPPSGGEYVDAGDQGLSYKLQESGTYYLRVYDYRADDTGDYLLSYYNLQGCSWPSISCAETLSGSIDNPSEFDIYAIEGQAGERIIVDAEVIAGTMHMRLALYPPSGGDYVEVGDDFLSYKLAESGTYYIRVADSYVDKTGDYRLSYYNLQGCSWPSLSCGETLAGSIDNPSEFDIYAIEGQAGERIIVDAEVIAGTMDMRLALYPPSGGDYVEAGDDFLSYKLAESGTYYIRVADSYVDETGDYQLSYYNLQGCSWPSLSCGETLAGSIDNPSEFDIYVIEGQIGEQITIDAEVLTGMMDVRLVLYPPDGRDYVASGNDRLPYEFAQSGTHYLRVNDAYVDETGTYEVTLTCGDGEPDLTVSSLTVSRNPAVQCEGDVTVGWTVKNQGDAVATPTGYSLVIRLSEDANYDASDMLICETTADVELLAGDTVTGTCMVDPNALTPGGYYVVAMVDVADAVVESNETNNTASASLTVVPPSPECMLTISSTERGSVASPGEGDFSYECGTCVTVKAVPDPNCAFDRWTGSAVDAGKVQDPCEPETTVCLDGDEATPCEGIDYTLVAHFVELPPPDCDVRTLAATEITATSALLCGEVLGDCGSSCEHRFVYWKEGEDQRYETPWEACGDGEAIFCAFVAELTPATLYCFAAEVRNDETFISGAPECFRTGVRLTVSVTQGGIITVLPPGGTVVYPEKKAFEYAEPNDVAIIAEPIDPNYTFWCWKGSAVDDGKVENVNSPATTVTVDDDDTLHAAFLRDYCGEAFLDPAPCRGAEGSTSQCWDFGDGETDDPGRAVYDVTGWPNDGVPPLAGTSLVCADAPGECTEQWWAEDVFWASGRHGLLSASGLRAKIEVPASGRTNTAVYVQVIWHEAPNCDQASEVPCRPVFSGFEPFAVDVPIQITDAIDEKGWHCSTYMWRVSPSPQTVAFTLRGQIVIDALLIETCTEAGRLIHVDDDAPSDPGPNDIGISDPAEDGTEAHPFDSVQEGIDAADDGDTVLVHDGRYVETIYVSDQAITITAQWLDTEANVHAASIIDANGLGPVVRCVGGKDRGCRISGLTITGGKRLTDAAIVCDQAEPYFSNCLIVGNMALSEGGTVVTCIDSEPNFVNCTISGNRAGPAGAIFGFVDSPALLVNSILWANDGPELVSVSGPAPEIEYSDIASALAGPGILHADPLFAAPGYWDDLGTPEEPADDLWIEGDYHLQSSAGRWDLESGAWLLDAAASPCIDAGNPGSLIGSEPEPNGGRINLGTYGGTTQASKSP